MSTSGGTSGGSGDATSLQGRALAATAPANGQAVVWNAGTSTWEPANQTPTGALLIANNLSDLNNAATARTNLGLGTAATHPDTDFLLVASNLSDLANLQTARNNLAGAVTNRRSLRADGTNVTLAAIQAADVPTLDQNTAGTAANVTGTVAIANGGTGQITQAAAIDALTGTQASGKFLRSDGTHATLQNIAEADVTSLVADLALKAPIASPTFTGTTTAPEYSASGLTGATANATRYVGGTNSSAPTTGTFNTGDFVIDTSGILWICIVGGSPGIWSNIALGGSADVAAFTATGTWTKQANVKWVEVICIGSGGGGGSGRLGATASLRGGGGGGGPGQVVREEFQAADLTATVAVTIPGGGGGGAAKNGAAANGNPGGAPAAVTFGAFVSAASGGAGGGGTSAVGGAGGAQAAGTFTPSWVSQGAGATGATGGVGAGTSAGGSGVAGAPGAGGAGGGISAAAAVDNGSAGGGGGGVTGANANKLTGGAGGGSTGANGTAGTASGTSPSSSLTGGSGGGGGASGDATTGATVGGAGAVGGTWGAGGGGGGAATTVASVGTSGAGGAGGKGYVIVISHRSA